MTRPRVHLAHDWLVGLRGGEWVLDALARMYGPTTIYTMVHDGRPLTRAIDACRIVTSPLQQFPGAAGGLRRWCLPLFPWAVERLRVRGPGDLDGCDLLISTSSAAIKAIRPPRGVPHLCYCHSPARYAWDQADDYAHGALGGLRRAGLRAIRGRFQAWDRRTTHRVTRFLANSAHTARRIERHYHREATVIHPPVRTEFFTPEPTVSRGDSMLVVSALEPYKRIDLAIRACVSRNIPLVIAGIGSQRRSLERLAREVGSGSGAKARIEFRGRVDDACLRHLYRSSRAFLNPQAEDFGITAVESQSCGCPVIAYRAGGAVETVAEGCGVFFDEQSEASLTDAIARLDHAGIEPSACRRNAERFSVGRFETALDEVVQTLL